MESLVVGQYQLSSSNPRPRLADQLLVWWVSSLSLLNECQWDGIDCTQGQGVVDIPPALKGCCQTLEDLVVPPGIAALCEAGLTTSQDMVESHWRWTEGTGWVLTNTTDRGFLKMGAHHKYL